VRVRLVSGVFFMIGITVGDADAAYLIQLKNGNDYVTSRYWRDGSQVLFDTYGGVFGVDKNFVAQIIKTDQVIRFANAINREPGNKLAVDGLNDKKAVDANSKDETVFGQKEDDNDPIRGEFNRLKEKTTEVDGMLTAEMRELLNQITAFKNKLSRDSKLFIQYGREFNDAHELGNTVETALASRTQ
jgi:hypothetical protein